MHSNAQKDLLWAAYKQELKEAFPAPDCADWLEYVRPPPSLLPLLSLPQPLLCPLTVSVASFTVPHPLT